jgi:peptide-methionine (S)-S-oxide reductase
MFTRKQHTAPNKNAAPPDRPAPPELSGVHFVSGRSIVAPFPDGIETIYLGMGCFWGAEQIFWELPGVYSTAAGYSGGFTENASYEDVCTGRTGHAEVVLVAYDPDIITLDRVLKSFWEQHDPTQGDRQGNDVGSQYRSAVYWSTESQRDEATRSRDGYATALRDGGFGHLTTEIEQAGDFFYAEEYHQQYLAKNPGGYCNHGFCQLTYTSPVSSDE